MHLSAIYIYPIKSLSGISLQKTRLTRRGLAYDRRFMLTTPDGMFITQRTNQNMVFLKTAIVDDRLVVKHSQSPFASIEIPLSPQHFIREQEVKVWKDICIGRVMHDHINEWFSRCLDQACQLVYMPSDSRRTIEEKHAKEGEVVSFADAYPILLLGQSGLDDLNDKLMTPVSIDRFRPNMVFTGGAPFEEDNWKSFQIGQQLFRVVKPCARCLIPNINPITGAIEKEPNKTLATFRRFNKKIYVGVNVCWETNEVAESQQIQIGEDIVSIKTC